MNKFLKVKLALAGVSLAIGLLSNIKVSYALTDNAVTPEQYGANGTDTKNDAKALQRALNASTNVVLKGGATYYISSPLTVDHTVNITTTGGKASIVKTSLRKKEIAFHFKNDAVSQSRMHNTAKKGQKYIEVYGTKGVHVGDLVHLKSSKLWKWDNRGYLTKGELLRVKKVEDKKIYFETPLQDSYYVSGEQVTVSNYRNQTIHMKDVSFSYEKPFDSQKELVLIEQTTNALLENVEVKKAPRLGIRLQRTYQTTVTGAHVDLGTTPDIPSGYGIQDYGGTFNTVKNSYFSHVRRGVDFSGETPSRFGSVKNSEAVGPAKNKLASGNSGFGTHSTAENIVFENNKINGFSYSFLSRGDHIVIKNNHASGVIRAFVAAGFGDNLYVSNNRYEHGGNAENFLRVIKTFDGNITLQHNYAGVLVKDFAQNDAKGLKGLQLTANRGVFVQKSKSPSYLVRSLDSVKLKNTIIEKNSMTMRKGKKRFVTRLDLSDKSNMTDKVY